MNILGIARTYTLLGTTEYLSPEVIEGKGYGLAADWWALGILLFEMAVGYPPFFGKNPFIVYKKILECKPPYPSGLSSSTKSIVGGFLNVNRARRLGCAIYPQLSLYLYVCIFVC